MKASEYARIFLGICAMVAVLCACGGLQAPIVAPGPMQQTAAVAAHHNPSGYRVLYNFAGGSDGANPYAGLIDVEGTLYGTTEAGGNSGCYNALGCGTIFSVTPTGTEQVLHTFVGAPSDGAEPYAGLINVNGTLYGTTFYGGAHGYGTYYPAGTVFSVTTTGEETVLYSFGYDSAYGFGPYANLIDIKGTLYSTTYDGGMYYLGTVFSVTTTGTEKVVHSFGHGADGLQPLAGLISVKGVQYGTTPTGGAHGIGTVFSVTRAGVEKVIYSFSGASDGGNPDAALVDVDGTLYGTTSAGGPHYGGTVFSVTTSGNLKTLYRFCSKRNCADGSGPEGQLLDVKGKLYGTTIYGGKYSCRGQHLCGTLFSITTSGDETVLHSFGASGDGTNPYAGLINVHGTLYGTTTYGGTYGAGTVFAFTP